MCGDWIDRLFAVLDYVFIWHVKFIFWRNKNFELQLSKPGIMTSDGFQWVSINFVVFEYFRQLFLHVSFYREYASL